MVIIASKEGQFANRVIHFAHIYSFCRANGISLHHAYFNDYTECFPNLKSDPLIHIWGDGLMARWGRILVNLFARILIRLRLTNLGFVEVIPCLRYDQEAPMFELSNQRIIRKAKRKVVILYGWLFRDTRNFRNYWQEIKHLFALPETSNEKAERLINKIRSEYDIVIGVHIRRGDYKRFENGRWYYGNEVYKVKMAMLAKEIKDAGKRPAFVLCSNDSIDAETFAPLSIFFLKEDFLIDFLLLKKSDYIIGPPSTFSALASYWGEVYLQHIFSADEAVQLNKMRIIERL